MPRRRRSRWPPWPGGWGWPRRPCVPGTGATASARAVTPRARTAATRLPTCSVSRQMRRLTLEGVSPAEAARVALAGPAESSPRHAASEQPSGRIGRPAAQHRCRGARSDQGCAGPGRPHHRQDRRRGASRSTVCSGRGTRCCSRSSPAIGERWQETGNGVDVEHLMAESVLGALRSVDVVGAAAAERPAGPAGLRPRRAAHPAARSAGRCTGRAGDRRQGAGRPGPWPGPGRRGPPRGSQRGLPVGPPTRGGRSGPGRCDPGDASTRPHRRRWPRLAGPASRRGPSSVATLSEAVTVLQRAAGG